MEKNFSKNIVGLLFLATLSVLEDCNKSTVTNRKPASLTKLPLVYFTESELLQALDSGNGTIVVSRLYEMFQSVPRILIEPSRLSFDLGLWNEIKLFGFMAVKFNLENEHKPGFIRAEIWIGARATVEQKHIPELSSITTKLNNLYSHTISIKLFVLSPLSRHNQLENIYSEELEFFDKEFPNNIEILHLNNMQEIYKETANCTKSLNISSRKRVSFFVYIYYDEANDLGIWNSCKNHISGILNKPNIVLKTNLNISEITKSPTTFLLGTNSSKYLAGINRILEEHANVDLSIFYEKPEPAITTKPQACKTNYTKEDWLQTKSINTIKAGAGFSTRFDLGLFDNEKLVQTLISNSPNLIIENAQNLTESSNDQITEALNSIRAGFKTYSDSNQNSVIDLDKTCSLQITIKLNFYTKYGISEYVTRAKTALLVATRTNSASSELFRVTSLVVNLLGEGTRQARIYKEVLQALRHNTSINANNSIKLGIVLSSCKANERIPDLADQIYYEHYTKPYKHDSSPSCYEDYEKDFSDQLTQCQKKMQRAKLRGAENILYVAATGSDCEKPTNENQMLRYGTLTDAILNTLLYRDEMLYFYPAFEFGSLPSSKSINSSCGASAVQEDKLQTYLNSAKCFRGWWLVTNDTTNKDEYLIIDKKTALRSLANISYDGSTIPSQTDDNIYKNRIHLLNREKCVVPLNHNEHFIPLNDFASPPPQNNSMWWVVLFLAIIVVVVFATLGFAYVVLRVRYKYLLDREEVHRFFNGETQKSESLEKSEEDGSLLAMSMKYNRTLYEISESSFSIDESKSLGSGEFGTIFMGSVKRKQEVVNVAVKTIKNGLSKADTGYVNAVRGLISEIKILSYINNHNNIVQLVGAYTAKLQTGYVLAFLELCELGSLQDYLRNVKPCIIHTSYDHQNIATLSPDLKKDLFTWSKQIVDGMEYISSKNLVHADLATRNILLDSEKVAKISDFGLSRRLYDYTQYVKSKQEPLPWRWMAPEALKRLTFNEKTDVWAFGVTLWEMYTLGDTPYPGLSWDVDFPEKLENGLKPGQPKYDQQNMYNIMERCWKIDPMERPGFAELKIKLCGYRYANI